MFEQVLPGNTKAILALLEKSEIIRKAYLAGGTAEIHIMKSLIYFEDAEPDDMPEMRKEADWEDIKKYFENEVKKMVK